MSQSMTLSAAAAILAFCGSASALHLSGSAALPYGNMTASVVASASVNAPLSTGSVLPTPDMYCPQNNGEVITGPQNVDYRISCNENAQGVLINYSAPGFANKKRQEINAPTSLTDCLNVCSTLASCAAASYDTNTDICQLFSSITARGAAPGVEFALKIVEPSSSSTAVASTGSPASTGFPASSGFPGASSSGLVAYPMNGTSTAMVGPTGTGSVTPTASPVNLFCPYLDAQIFADSNGRDYMIECDRNHVGTIISSQVVSKRQAVQTPSLLNCMNICDATPDCVATAFDNDVETCTFFSEIGGAYYSEGIDFAFLVADNGVAATTTAAPAGPSSSVITEYATSSLTLTRCAPGVVCPAGSTIVSQTLIPTATITVPMTTSTVYRTDVSTITACPSTVLNCPLTAGMTAATVTEVVVDYVTVCPAVSGAPTGVVTGPAGPMTTSTLYSTSVETITSCGAQVVNCPLTAGQTAAVITKVVSVGTVGGAAPMTTAGPSTIYSTEVNTIYSCGPEVTNCPLTAGQTAATVTKVVAVGTASADVPMTTSTIYSTKMNTIYSCGPEVQNCPLTAGMTAATVTELVAVSTTICPVSGAASGTPAAASGPSDVAVGTPLACSSCPYAAVTATVYSASTVVVACNTCPAGSSTAMTMVPVATTHVNYPVPTAPAAVTTILSTATAPSSTYITAVSTSVLTSNIVYATAASCPGGEHCPSGSSAVATGSAGVSCPGGSSCPAATTGVMAFTGAANSIKSAGMGLAAIIIGAAFML